MKTKSKKWYKSVLYHFFDLCLVNAYILYKEKTVMPLYKFKLDVAISLMYGDIYENPVNIQEVMEELAEAATTAPNGDPMAAAEVVDFIRFDMVNHFPESVASQGRMCKRQGCKKRSVIWCKKCRVYLCVKTERNKAVKNKNCFELFHTAD